MKILRKQDKWLIKRWAKARQLEDSMDSARQRYADLFAEIHKQIRKTHSALSRMHLHMQPREIEQWGGQVGFAKIAWPGRYEGWPTGIYIWGISLDELTSDSPPAPSASIWVRLNSDRNEKARQAVLRRRLAAKAGPVFKNRRLNWSTEEEDGDNTCLWYPLPEGSAGLLRMLCADGRSFVDCIAKHVNLLAAFIPVMDAALLKRISTRR